MKIRLNPIAEKGAAIAVHIIRAGGPEEKCGIAPCGLAQTAQNTFYLEQGDKCAMENTDAGRAYVYAQIGSDLEVTIAGKTDKLRPSPCGQESQMFALKKGKPVKFLAI